MKGQEWNSHSVMWLHVFVCLCVSNVSYWSLAWLHTPHTKWEQKAPCSETLSQLSKRRIFKDFIYLFLERGGKERNFDVQEKLALSRVPPTDTWPATQACALTGNRTSNLSVCRPALNPLSHTSQGKEKNLRLNRCLYRMWILFFNK